MNLYDPAGVAQGAVSAAADRPAVALVHDHDDARVVVFRLGPGQQVATHTSTSSVFLSVVSGTGYVTGGEGERAVVPGDLVAFAPREPHGMRADRDEFVLTAVITPRPGAR
ncbi:MAG TPA: cupin domain-containing protein [Gemmatimonadales bacterium]|nr:cupin domain-containing protein [Gemmatimonadales bacterium]